MTKVACILPSRIGDIVFSFPAIKSIKKSLKSAHITFFVDKRYKDLVDLNPNIDLVISYDFKLLKNPLNLFKAYKFFRNFNFNIAFDMQGYLKSSLVMLFIKAKYKFGTSPSPKEPAFLFSKFPYKYKEFENVHRVDRHLFSLEKIFKDYLKIPFKKEVDFSYAFTQNEIEKIFSKLKFFFEKDKTYFLLFLGGGWISRRWGYKNYFYLSRKLQEKYGFIPVLVGGAPSGSPEEDEYINFIKLATKENLKFLNLYNQISLKEYIYLCKFSKDFNIKFFIGNDAGATHIAWSAGVYSFEILGPTSPEVVRPYINGEAIYKKVSCSPCRNRNCKLLLCMKNIKVKDVLNKIERFLNA